jgi:enamine deaminase RidA (YjgF/YER057c/UK114 family)
MSHTRIRPFNTRDAGGGSGIGSDLCEAVVADNIVFLRGQTGRDLETNESVGGGDAGAQAERAMANVELLLKEAGARLEDICKVMVYLTDDRHRDAVYEVLGRRLAGVYPCSAGVVVSGLARPEWVVSIDVTAVIPARR